MIQMFHAAVLDDAGVRVTLLDDCVVTVTRATSPCLVCQ